MKNAIVLEKNLVDQIKKLEEKIQNQGIAKIYSSSLLSDEEIEMIKKNFPMLNQRRVINIVNKELLAGVVIEVEGEVIDFSLRGRLNKLKKILYEINQ